MGKKARNILFSLMLILLMIPILQDTTHFIKSIPLVGAIIEPEYEQFTWKGWWSGSYQSKLSEYAKGKTAVRPDIIRLANQIDFSLFQKIKAGDVTIGKDGYLFGKGFVDRYCGTEKQTYDQLAHHLFRIKKIQDTLARLGVSMICIHAASKASFYAEYIPEDIKCNANNNDHMVFNHIADSLGITIVDFNNWFVSLKGKTPGHLFTRLGLHWSIYGASVSGDSFVRYIRNRGVDLPDLKWDIGPPHLKPEYSDNDIYRELNLMFPAQGDTYYYPSLRCDAMNKSKPKMIFVADSFMWSWIQNKVPQSISDDWEFWYYNSTVYRDSKDPVKMAEYDWPSQLVKSKFVVLMFSEAALSDYGAGFVENTYAHFYVKSHEAGK